GRFLATFTGGHPERTPAWIAWLFAKFGINDAWSGTSIYDLTSGEEVASFANAPGSHFSLDGKSLALLSRDGTLSVYDLPLRRPWARIAGIALGVAAGVWLVSALLSWRFGKVKVQSVAS